MVAHDQVVPQIHYTDHCALLLDKKESLLHVVSRNASLHGHLPNWHYYIDDKVFTRDKHDGSLGSDGSDRLRAHVHLPKPILQTNEKRQARATSPNIAACRPTSGRPL